MGASAVCDPSEESQSGPAETVIAQFPVDFSPATPGLIPTFAAIVDVDSGTATFNVRLSTILRTSRRWRSAFRVLAAECRRPAPGQRAVRALTRLNRG
jgi:hypothetical protein